MKNLALIIVTLGPALCSPRLHGAIFEFTGSSTGDHQLNTVTSQPTHGYYSTFNRIGVVWNTGDNVFNSRTWSTDTSLDPFKYNSFTITPDVGYQLSLSSLTFDCRRSGTGPLNGQVSLFLNGFASPTATYSFAPGTGTTSYTFDFNDVIGATGAEFRFTGFGAGGATGTMMFDNVMAADFFMPVPEPQAYGAVVSAALLVFAAWGRWNHLRIGNTNIMPPRRGLNP
jgi:hypothetical protein